MGFFSGGGKGGNESGGSVNGKHRGQPAKGKGGVNKPLKGTRHAPKGKNGGFSRQNNGGWGGGTGAAAGNDRWG